MRPIFIFIITLFCALCAFAQTETPDSVKARELNEVVVGSYGVVVHEQQAYCPECNRSS